MTLDGKTILVTGAARGIGFAIAQSCLAAGANVMLTDIDEEALAKAAADLKGAVEYCVLDVRSDESWAGAVKATEEHFGHLSGVVNNAGIETASFLVDIEAADITNVFGINVLGVMLGTKHGFRAMRPGGSSGNGGVVINIASSAAAMHTAGLSNYSASKAAVTHFTRNAAVEAGQLGYGIRVNCVMPGMTNTPMAAQFSQHFVDLGMVGDAEEMNRLMMAKILSGRFADPSEIGDFVAFLASDKGDYITGACMPIDGGVTLT